MKLDFANFGGYESRGKTMRKKLSDIQPGERFRCPLRGLQYLMIGPCDGGFGVQFHDGTVGRWKGGTTEYEIIPPTPEPKYRPDDGSPFGVLETSNE